MTRIGILTAVLLAAAAPADAQIVRPTLAMPCVVKHCPGARPSPAPTAQSRYCPPGTVYLPQKGTCKVLPPPAAPQN